MDSTQQFSPVNGDDVCAIGLVITNSITTTVVTSNRILDEQRDKSSSFTYKQNVSPNGYTSNALFLLGSCLYVWLAIWDIQLEKSWYNVVPDENDDSQQNKNNVWWNPYMIVSVLAASCYVVDAISFVCSQSVQHFGEEQPIENDVSTTPIHNQLVHRFHQSSKVSALLVGITFGLGAILELLSAITSEMTDSTICDWAVVGAAHSYMANAILLLAGKKIMYQTPSQRVTVIGDFLFLIGSIVDVSLSYFYIGQESDVVWKYVYIGYLCSSILWLLNAILYTAAELLYDDSPMDVMRSCTNIKLDHQQQRISSLTNHKKSSPKRRIDILLEDSSLCLVEE